MISDAFLQGPADVAVWAVWLGAPAAAAGALRALLSSEEIERADRFAYPHLRAAYEVSHGVLRILLSQYLKCGPRNLELTCGHAGKPELPGNSRLRFNMSHSGSLAMYAFTFDCEIGLDVEEIRHMPDVEPIARHYFCAEEASQLLSVTGGKQQQEAFFRCWTRKESYIKATGDGLSVPLDEFQVTLLPGSPARLVHIGRSADAASAWTLHHLEPAPGYVGAVAYRALARQLVLHPPLPAREFLDLVTP